MPVSSPLPREFMGFLRFPNPSVLFIPIWGGSVEHFNQTALELTGVHPSSRTVPYDRVMRALLAS
jgi:hypothetical protein